MMLLSGLLWADEPEPNWIGAPVIDLSVYEGIGSLFLEWSVPDTIQVERVRIYDRSSNYDPFELKTELFNINWLILYHEKGSNKQT